MITKKTVLILGAGASMPFDFPSGPNLVTKICETFSHMNNIHSNHIRNIGFDLPTFDRFVDFSHALQHSGQSSIDAFLEHNPDFMVIGKQAIASILLQHETTDCLFQNMNRKNNWYQTLFGRLNTSIDDFANNNLSVVTFNYDRSLEHYLHTALKNSHHMSGREATQKMQSIPIVHLHGQLGKLPWQASGEAEVEFKGELTADRVSNAAEGIKIIHEDISNEPEFGKAFELFEEAERIYILGFGFNELNLQRLRLDSLLNARKYIRGTLYNPNIEQQKLAREYTNKSRFKIVDRFFDKTIYNFLTYDQLLD